MNNKRIVTAAITGGDTVPSQSEYLPITPQQIIDEAVRCANAGAAVIHIHARNPEDGRPSSDPEVFKEIMGGIKDKCDAIICPTTGGNVNMTREERLTILPRFKPEMATFNLGSMNYSIHFLADSFKRREKHFKYEWEQVYVESSKSAVFKNSFEDLEYTLGLMNENEVKPECEIYDLGMIYNASYLVKLGLLKKPLQIQFVLGVLGGAPAEIKILHFLKEISDDVFGSDQFTWSVVGAGYPQEFIMCSQAILMGGNIRVGMEDNFRINSRQLAKSNAELVEKAVKIIRTLDCDVATPIEARNMLQLKGADKVSF